MGFENEADQSLGRLCHSMNGGAKRTCDLTSFIVPRGTSCHRAVEFAFSPIGFDLALSCGCSLLLGPAELCAVNPDTVQDHGQPSRRCDNRSFHPGNRYLRVLFVQAAWVVLIKPRSWERHGLKHWIEAARRRLHRNVLAIALANKLARIAWGVLAGSRSFEASKLQAA
jgi:hypothetical protein